MVNQDGGPREDGDEKHNANLPAQHLFLFYGRRTDPQPEKISRGQKDQSDPEIRAPELV